MTKKSKYKSTASHRVAGFASAESVIVLPTPTPTVAAGTASGRSRPPHGEPTQYVFHPRALQCYVPRAVIERWKADTEQAFAPWGALFDTEGAEVFLDKPCPRCLERCLVRVIDCIRPTGVSIGRSGYGLEGEVSRSHVECRGCGYRLPEAAEEVQDERPPANDDPA